MHKGNRERLNVKRGRSVAGKTVVMGLLARNGKDGHSTMRTEILSSLKRDRVQGHVRNHVETGATLHTDAFQSYSGLDADYAHTVVDHAECYCDGNVHTNGCENFWSLLKRAIKRTYVSTEPFHRFRYLDEQCFRFNNREGTDATRFVLASRASSANASPTTASSGRRFRKRAEKSLPQLRRGRRVSLAHGTT